MPEFIGLDFETYSAVDLFRHGLHRYADSGTFTPLIGSTASARGGGKYYKQTLDFTNGFDRAVNNLRLRLIDKVICAHNAGFEQRVLSAIGIDLPSSRFIDSAVIARALGAGGKLEAAAPQLLGVDKLEDGKRLIQLFSIPGKLQEAYDSLMFDPEIIVQNPIDWKLFGVYCELDAELSLRIVEYGVGSLTANELENMAITMDMNNTGWPVDIAIVEEMQRRYLENMSQALQDFRVTQNALELNLNSLPQMKAWCLARGVKATSFDEKHVASLLARVKKKLDSGTVNKGTAQNYEEVQALLETKQTLGGSSLKKLVVLLDTVGADGRLRDQYLHCGAGQTLRTTGRSVQMQNLKRLSAPADMGSLLPGGAYEDFIEWNNDKLAENIRQCFTSNHLNGQLIVGDFASVESRGLAWLANENWKLNAYSNGDDLYKTLAAIIYTVKYDNVTKAQRQTGKVGELSCGYGAGGGAVQAFAANMGVTMSEGEASKLVADWRQSNPKIVAFWYRLDEMLDQVLGGGVSGYPGAHHTVLHVGEGFKLRLYRSVTPSSLTDQLNGAVSIAMEVSDHHDRIFLVRYFHGCYRRGRDICYFKPSARKTGDLWSPSYVDPKTKQLKHYSIYGGKLAGILTQSFCREVFFNSLRNVSHWLEGVDNVQLIGQFHDEIVLDWQPWGSGVPTSRQMTLEGVLSELKGQMSHTGIISGFPLEADIKHDYRYIK